MAPTSGLPRYSTQSSWSLQRAWSMPRSKVSNKIIYPGQMAWCKTYETLWGGKIQPGSYYEWVTEDEYLILKIKGEV